MAEPIEGQSPLPSVRVYVRETACVTAEQVPEIEKVTSGVTGRAMCCISPVWRRRCPAHRGSPPCPPPGSWRGWSCAGGSDDESPLAGSGPGMAKYDFITIIKIITNTTTITIIFIAIINIITNTIVFIITSIFILIINTIIITIKADTVISLISLL